MGWGRGWVINRSCLGVALCIFWIKCSYNKEAITWTLSIASVKVNLKIRRRALSQTRRILEELRIRQ